MNTIKRFSSTYKKNVFNHDFPDKEKLISISRLAELTETSRDTLVYYIKEGLITPVFTSESGYKYFHPDQLRTMTYIKFMRRCGIHISEIRQMLKNMDAGEIYCLLEKRRQELSGQITVLERTLGFMDTLDDFLEFTGDYETDAPFLSELAEKELYLTPVPFCRGLNNLPDAGKFADFIDPSTGLPDQLLCCRIPESILQKGNFCEYMHQNADRVNQEKAGKKILRPAGQYACIVQQGGTAAIKETIQSLSRFIHSEGYLPSGDAYILSSTGFLNLTSASDQRYVAEIAVR